MNQRNTLSLAFALNIIAASISAYLIYDHYQLVNGENFHSFCNINQYMNCDLVNTSQYSTFLGLPLGSWGLSFYIFAAFLTLLAAKSQFHLREAGLILIPLSIISVFLSFALALISIFIIKAMCILCISLYALNMLIAFFSWKAMRSHLLPITQEFRKADRTKLTFFSAFGLVSLLTVAGISKDMHKPLPFDSSDFKQKYESTSPVSIELNDSPRLGHLGSTPQIQLVEFSDFECPFCARQSKELLRIVRNYKDSVQLIFKHFPLDISCNRILKGPLHQYSCLAAKAAICAQEQGQFLEYHETLFLNQKQLSLDQMRQWARNAKLNIEAFDVCIQSEKTMLRLQKDIDLGISLGVGGTPTFFINGRKIPGLVTQETIEFILKNKL